jgi:hypothetical protein
MVLAGIQCCDSLQGLSHSGIFAILASILALCLPGLAAQAPQSKLDPKGLFAEASMTYKEY